MLIITNYMYFCNPAEGAAVICSSLARAGGQACRGAAEGAAACSSAHSICGAAEGPSQGTHARMAAPAQPPAPLLHLAGPSTTVRMHGSKLLCSQHCMTISRLWPAICPVFFADIDMLQHAIASCCVMQIDGQGWGPSTPPTPSAAHTPINASLSPTSNSSGDLNTIRGGNNSSRSSRLAPPHFDGSAAGKPSSGATPGPVVGSRAGSVSGSSSGAGGLSDTMLRRLTMPDGRPFAAQPAQLSGLRKAHTPPTTSGSIDSSSHSRASRAGVQLPQQQQQQQQPGFHLAADAPPGLQALAPSSHQRGFQQGDRISTGAAQPQQQQHPAERNGGGHQDRTAHHPR